LRSDVLCSFVRRSEARRMIDPAARGAWRDLEVKLRPFVARRIRGEADVDDVMQDILLRMHRGLGGLREDERFGPWVYRVARSAIIDHQRLTSKHRVANPPQQALEHAGSSPDERDTATTDIDPVTTPLEPDDGDRAIEQLLAGTIAVFVAALPSPYREALTLTELEGLTQKQAAEMLGISLPGMKSRVQRGRAQLRQALEDCCHIALDCRGRVVSCVVRPDGRLPKGCCE
jgi:RNA polymerase sigma-70 factor, ECF subfamily